ncbi:hypothetical protein B0H14DRAFT_2603719 [Mycena olivaceomarginata]|nr:hypothetical protein B0H14DRAFT_2603719 [Mycena olivaceomarginata]
MSKTKRALKIGFVLKKLLTVINYAKSCNLFENSFPQHYSTVSVLREDAIKADQHDFRQIDGSYFVFDDAVVRVDFNVVNPKNLDVRKLKPPRTLAELRLAGIHAFVLFPDNDGTLSYEQAKEVERLLRMSPDETDGAGSESAQVNEDDELEDEDEDDEMEDEDQQHFIDEMITVFAAVPPGGTAGT